MTNTHKRGVLVAVANPEGVAPLMAIAIAASDPNDEPPPRVLALVGQRGDAADGDAPATQAQARLPPPPALTAAIEYARAHGVTIDAVIVLDERLEVGVPAHQSAADRGGLEPPVVRHDGWEIAHLERGLHGEVCAFPFYVLSRAQQPA